MSYTTKLDLIESLLEELLTTEIDEIDDTHPFVPRKAFRTRPNGEIENAQKRRAVSEEQFKALLKYVKADILGTLRTLVTTIEQDNFEIEEMNRTRDKLIESRDRIKAEETRLTSERLKRYNEEDIELKKQLKKKRNEEFDKILSTNERPALNPITSPPTSALPSASFSFNMDVSSYDVDTPIFPAFTFQTSSSSSSISSAPTITTTPNLNVDILFTALEDDLRCDTNEELVEKYDRLSNKINF